MAVKKITGVKHKFSKNRKGDYVVDHPKGRGGRINVTKQSGARTKKEAIAASKKYHRTKPHKTK